MGWTWNCLEWGMSLLTVILVIVAVGLVLYVIHRWLPLPAEIKNLLNVVVILILVVWLLKSFGIIKWLSEVGL